MKIAKIVSGGQTGADRGGLDAAIHCHLPYGGWIPKGRLSEDGTIPATYEGLKETTSKDCRKRTEANVVDSDATIIFTYGSPKGGSELTAKLAMKHKAPCLLVDMDAPRDMIVDQVTEWIRGLSREELVLNVAGSRESKSPGIQRAVMVRLVDVISGVNGTLFYPLVENADDGTDATPYTPRPAAQTEEDIPLYHPRTVREAVDIIAGKHTEEDKADIRKQDKDEFATWAHVGLGMAIRNSMIYRNRNMIDLMADFQRGCRQGEWQGEAEPDDVSRVIVDLFWERLQES